MILFNLILLIFLFLSHCCTESQRTKVSISKGPGQIPASVEQLSGNAAKTDGSSGQIPATVERQSGKAAMDKKARKRFLRRRKQRLVKWCESRMRAKEIDSEVDWKKIIGATVLVLGLVHVLYFCHPVCYRGVEE